MLPRDCADVYACQLAAMRRGCAFCCVDAAFPDWHIRSVIEDALRKAIETPEHQQLVNKLNMAPWVRVGKAYDTYMQTQYAAMPALMQSFGVLPAR